jgi:hypothetical protein
LASLFLGKRFWVCVLQGSRKQRGAAVEAEIAVILSGLVGAAARLADPATASAAALVPVVATAGSKALRCEAAGETGQAVLAVLQAEASRIDPGGPEALAAELVGQFLNCPAELGIQWEPNDLSSWDITERRSHCVARLVWLVLGSDSAAASDSGRTRSILSGLWDVLSGVTTRSYMPEGAAERALLLLNAMICGEGTFGTTAPSGLWSPLGACVDAIGAYWKKVVAAGVALELEGADDVAGVSLQGVAEGMRCSAVFRAVAALETIPAFAAAVAMDNRFVETGSALTARLAALPTNAVLTRRAVLDILNGLLLARLPGAPFLPTALFQEVPISTTQASVEAVAEVFIPLAEVCWDESPFGDIRSFCAPPLTSRLL